MLPRLIFALGIYFVSGFTILSFALRPGGVSTAPLARASFAFLLGLGGVTLQMFLYSMAGIGFSPAIIALPWLALGAYAAFRTWNDRGDGPRRPGAGGVFSSGGTGVLGAFLLLVILSQVLYAFSHALASPLTEWDAVRTWFFKATAFYTDGRVSASVFKWDDLVHPDYPLLVPLSGAWVYACVGAIADTAVKAVYPLQFISLLAIFHFVARRSSTPLHALLFTALLSVTPILMVHAGGLPSSIGGLHTGDYVGVADLPLAAYLLAAGGTIYLYAVERRAGFIVLAALLLGFGAWTKNEGMTFLLIGSAVGLWLLVIEKRGKFELRPLIAFVAVAAAIALPWQIYKLNLNLAAHEDARISLSYAINSAGRLPEIFAFFKFIMFGKPPLFNFTWYLYIIGALLNWRGFFRRPMIYLNLLLFGQFSAYVLAYMLTVLDLNFHLATSCERLVLQLVPLAMLITALNFKEFLSIGEDAEPAP